MDELSKETIFRYTLELARKGWGRTHPNPMVGAIILEGGEITAQGYHRQAGDVHAEVDVSATSAARACCTSVVVSKT